MKDKLKKDLLRQVANFLSRLPLIGGNFRRWRIYHRYRLERQVIKGKHTSHSSHPSILFFTVYKAASSFIGSFMEKIVKEAGMTLVDLDGYFFELGEGRVWESSRRVIKTIPYQPTGYFYGPFRSFNRGITNIDDYKILLVIRDPRDVIVSSYFSMYSHAAPLIEDNKQIQIRRDRRKKKLELTVDNYVMNKLNEPGYLDKYYEYYQELMDKPNVLLLKYEDMVYDFDTWLNRLLKFLDLEVSESLMVEIKAAASFKVDKEDVYKHKRQVTPGDYKRKLKPETIEALNAKSYEILERFSY
jgi:hypothetical protein